MKTRPLVPEYTGKTYDICAAGLGNGSSPLNHADQYNHNRQQEQNMDEPAHRVRRNHSQKPQHQKYYEDCPQQGFVLLLFNSLN